MKEAMATVPLVSKHVQKAMLTLSKVKSREPRVILSKYRRMMEIAQTLTVSSP